MPFFKFSRSKFSAGSIQSSWRVLSKQTQHCGHHGILTSKRSPMCRQRGNSSCCPVNRGNQPPGFLVLVPNRWRSATCIGTVVSGLTGSTVISSAHFSFTNCIHGNKTVKVVLQSWTLKNNDTLAIARYCTSLEALWASFVIAECIAHAQSSMTILKGLR